MSDECRRMTVEIRPSLKPQRREASLKSIGESCPHWYSFHEEVGPGIMKPKLLATSNWD